MIAFAIWVVANIGVSFENRREAVECLKLQGWSIQFKEQGFYLLPWQKEQCESVEIAVDAPVIAVKGDGHVRCSDEANGACQYFDVPTPKK